MNNDWTCQASHPALDSLFDFLYNWVGNQSNRVEGAMGDEMLSLGEFEEIVLLAVRHLGSNAYGVPIRQAVEEARGRTTSIGAVYTTLERLEQKGMVSSALGEATPQRGGRAKRYYHLEG